MARRCCRAGKYVVEMVVPPGYELVKEEDKNILLGDAYVAPVTQQFAGFGNIFIMPDQAAVGATYNPNNPRSSRPTTGRRSRGTKVTPAGRGVLALRGRCAHRARLHQPVPAVGTERAVRRRHASISATAKRLPWRPDVGAGEVLCVHLDAYRRTLHGHHHGRLHL